jgi:hypothetical protein
MGYINDAGLAHLWQKIEQTAGDEIYIGSTPPPAESNYSVWVNPEGTPSSLVTLEQIQGLGYQTAAQVEAQVDAAID